MNRQIALILGLAIAGSSYSVLANDHESMHGESKGAMEIGVDTKLSIDQQFDRLDHNGDGMISHQEAKSNEHAEHAFQSFDDGDGKLSKKEFTAGLKARASGKGNVNAGASAEDGSLEGENAIVGAGTDTEIEAGAMLDQQATEMNDAANSVAAGIGASGAASDGEEAADNLSPALQTRFRGLDNNDDGVISRDEAKADPIIIGVFNTHDRNDNGKLNESEFVAAARAGVNVEGADDS